MDSAAGAHEMQALAAANRAPQGVAPAFTGYLKTREAGCTHATSRCYHHSSRGTGAARVCHPPCLPNLAARG